MLRITQFESDAGACLGLEGKLFAPWVEEAQLALSCATAKGTPSLDLSGLTYVDREGAAFLRQLQRDGVRIMGCSPFIALLISREQAPADSELKKGADPSRKPEFFDECHHAEGVRPLFQRPADL